MSGTLLAHPLAYLWCRRRTALGLPARRQPAWGEQEHRQVMRGMSALVPGASGNGEQQAAPQHAHPTRYFCLWLPSVPGAHHACCAYLVPRNHSQGSSCCSCFISCCWTEIWDVLPEKICSHRRSHFFLWRRCCSERGFRGFPYSTSSQGRGRGCTVCRLCCGRRHPGSCGRGSSWCLARGSLAHGYSMA